MGYCTYYRVKIIPDSAVIRQIIENDDDLYALHEDSDSYKWYDHDTDMCELSEKHPDYVFELSGEGEEAGDLWRKYYRNGKIQHCPARITYDPFDESKLE